jgi:hypothetical protein
MPARLLKHINEDNIGVSFAQYRIGECHPDRAGANN